MKSHNSVIGIVLLAAGSSSRMGRSKQLLKIHNKTLLEISIEAAAASKAKMIAVVLGANEALHRSVVENYPVDLVTNHQWHKGMGSSIKTGLKFVVEKAPGIEAVIFLVCDQPLISSEFIDKLILKFQHTRKPIVASQYAGTYGVPSIFGKRLFKDLLDLKDEQGARQIISKHLFETVFEDFAGGEMDLDTMEEYDRFIRSINVSEDQTKKPPR